MVVRPRMPMSRSDGTGVDGRVVRRSMPAAISKRPVTVSLACFRQYHAESAWTWERMALTRARWSRAAGTARAIGGRDRRALAADGAPSGWQRRRAMRARMLRDLPLTAMGRELRAGGQIEVEFIGRSFSLSTRGPPRSCVADHAHALNALAKAGMLLGRCRLMVRADHVWRTVQACCAYCRRNARDELPDASARALLRDAALRCNCGTIDLAIAATLDALRDRSRRIRFEP